MRLKLGKTDEEALKRARLHHRVMGMDLKFDNCITDKFVEYLRDNIKETNRGQNHDEER